MNRFYSILILVLFISHGCRKSNNNPVWERTYGKGKAIFIEATADSGLISCGEVESTPYLLKLDRDMNKVSDYKYSGTGIFNSAWSDTSISVATGSSNGKMLITCLDDKCNLLWDTTFSASFNIIFSTLCYLGNGQLLAVASGKMDSVYTEITGLYCVWFNTSGVITSKKEIRESSYMSANKIIADNSGNVFVALTRKNAGSESRATAAKYNKQLQKIWETELYNNPSFGAASLGITFDNSGNIYVAGKTKLPVSTGSVDNSVTVSLTGSGTIRWKQYLENTNTGVSVKIDDQGHVLMLNQNCFIIYSLNSNNGSNEGIIRTFNACESKNTTNFGWAFDINYNKYIVMAGSNGNRFYVCQKPPLSYVQGNN
jgi:hypothetical protein